METLLEAKARSILDHMGLPRDPSVGHIHPKARRTASQPSQPFPPSDLPSAIRGTARKLQASLGPAGRHGHYDVSAIRPDDLSPGSGLLIAYLYWMGPK